MNRREPEQHVDSDELSAKMDELNSVLIGVENVQRLLAIPPLRIWPSWSWLVFYELAIAVACSVAVWKDHAIYVWPGSILAAVVFTVWVMRFIEERVVTGESLRLITERLQYWEKWKAALANEQAADHQSAAVPQ